MQRNFSFGSDLPLELVPRNCTTRDYQPIAVPSFDVRGEFIAYASPESTYAITRRLIEAATRSILIGIYDFNAAHMRDLLASALQRGVKVSLMVDLDNIKGENECFQELVQVGAEGVPAPSCASRHARYFPSCHEKVIVIDGEWSLVQSGNYSNNSLPRNEVDGGEPSNFARGNRDTGVAIRSAPLAAFFTHLLRSDMQLEIDGSLEEALELEVPPGPEISLEAPLPPSVPPRLFSSRRYRPRKAVRVVPVISPENYLQVIPDFLAAARRSIFIEQQYIRGSQVHIRRLLSAIASAWERSPRLDVRVVLARPFGSDLSKEFKNLQELETFGLKLGKHIRYLNPRYFTHCHNKLIVVDRQAVLVSSQNWSNSAVSENREAGLLLHNPTLARYYSDIFLVDWETGLKSPVLAGGVELPGGMETAVEMVPVSIGDYVEV